MIEINDVDKKDYAVLEKIYYEIRMNEFAWEKEVCLDDFKKHTEGEKILVGFIDGAALIAEANRKYGGPLSLKCMKDNKNALAFYEKNGWQIRDSGMCEEGEYYFMRQNVVEK